MNTRAPDTLEPAFNWRRHALCAEAGADPDLFFPDGDSPRYAAQIGEALAYCRACPVVAECLDAALRDEGGRVKTYRYGIRGGLTRGQRYRLYQRQARARATAKTA